MLVPPTRRAVCSTSTSPVTNKAETNRNVYTVHTLTNNTQNYNAAQQLSQMHFQAANGEDLVILACTVFD